MIDKENLNLGEAASRFRNGLAPEKRAASQQVVSRFVRWYGRERSFGGLTAPKVASYAETLSQSDTDYAGTLELLRAFLVFARKKGRSQIGLSTHLKAKKSKTVSSGGGRGLPKEIILTAEGMAALKVEIDGLKEKRLEVIDEIRRAAADKDFRENAPLAAAREQKGHLDGRLIELEEKLKYAVVLKKEGKRALKVGIGDRVTLRETASAEEVSYLIVDPREVDPLQGKISIVSPIGRALEGCGEGQEIEVNVPAGKLRYRIERIGR